ncbi:MAG: hypothetical protein K6G44_18480 [Lentisphaeria bacterium]|nr:hypothetical protein [Lentisphaeria bacterium]
MARPARDVMGTASSAGCAPLRALACGYAWFRAPRSVADATESRCRTA